jgi:hypothetical protein
LADGRAYAAGLSQVLLDLAMPHWQKRQINTSAQRGYYGTR